MPNIIIHHNKIGDPEALLELCPFGAFEVRAGKLTINSGCRMCRLCVKKGPAGVFEWMDDQTAAALDKAKWRGVAVYVDHVEGEIHPVSYELIGKARELAARIGHPVYALLMGSGMADKAREVLAYGVDTVFLYDRPELKDFRIEPYTAVFEDFITRNQPSICLVGGTTVGRSLAPRVAARFRTGLTADCTLLDVQESTDLDQIRPAFGGNIMAHIHTPAHRPQFATVRYKIFSAPDPAASPQGKVVTCEIPAARLASAITVLETRPKEKVKSIEDADVIVVAGRGIGKRENLALVETLAERLGGMVAATRPLIEMGWVEARRQIGLSGRTVKPKLIITCGVSGAIQFVAGMKGAEQIMAINTDPDATIFNVAHQAIIGDVQEILPQLINRLEQTTPAASPGETELAGALA